MKRDLRIGSRPIGKKHKPFMVAEMSGNHMGSLERALQIVREAAGNGADAIKLQTFTASTLTIDSRRAEFFIDDPQTPWHGRRLWDLYNEAHTPWDWHGPIFDEARRAGLACISTAFDESSLELLVKLEVDAIKISSFELIHLPLIRRAAQTGKPILVSVGMASLDEIDDAVKTLRANDCERFVLLKCTSAYPSYESDANLLTLQAMAARYGCEVGLSDHCMRPYAAFAAVALGAAVIEKHLTLDRSLGGVDGRFSVEPHEFREVATGAEWAWKSLGGVAYGCRDSERASAKERPSIYVVRPIRNGEAFTRENLRIIRPGNGLPPRYYDALINRRCAQDVEGGTPMSWDFLGDSDELRQPGGSIVRMTIPAKQ